MPLRGKPAQTITISATTFFSAAAFVLGFWLLWYLRGVLAIVLCAVVLAALIDPFASALARRHIPRALAAIGVYVVLGLIMVFLLIQLFPVIIAEASSFLSQLADTLGSLESSETLQGPWVSGLAQSVHATIGSLPNTAADSISPFLSTVKGFLGGVAALLITFSLAFYLVVEEDAARKFFKQFLPEEYHPYVTRLFAQMQQRIGSWLRAQLLLGLTLGIVVYIGLRLIGVEYALLLALMAGLFEIIPYAGPLLAFLPAALLGFGESFWQGIAVCVLYVLVQQVENHILVPKIMQRSVGLHPVVSIVALLVGARVGGATGALLAIPLSTILAVIVEDIIDHRDSLPV
ncbi:AI-2E family transporter [Candidatus Uhrbacteria bacterium]|nr:AI-2E family transporter [Candidatus Uhrbacteria bacterium]